MQKNSGKTSTFVGESDAGDPGAVIVGGGEMGEAVRAFDWSATPLGPMDQWPQSLRVAVGICLNSRFPMFVWWGPELINLYNDAYAPVLGKRHPEALGRPARDIWGEIWPTVGPQAEAVMTRGEATWNERVLLVMERNNYTEDTWFTWSYSPIPDETGAVRGLFCACTEETPRVRVEAERNGLIRQLERERTRLAEAFEESPAFVAVVRGPDHVFDLANERYYQLVGHRDILGKPVCEALPEVAGQGFIELLDRVYESGEPYVGTGMPLAIRRRPAQPPEQVIVDFVYQPMLGVDDAVVGILVHGVDVTEHKRAEEALRRSESRYERLVEQSPLSIQTFAPDGRVRQVNAAWENLFGATLEDAPDYNVLEDEQLSEHGIMPLIRKAFAGEAVAIAPIPYVAAQGRYAGQPRWCGAYGYPVKDDDGRIDEVVLIHHDLTEQRAAQEALRESEARLRAIVTHSAAGIAQTDLEGRLLFANRRYCELIGYSLEEVLRLRLRVQDVTHPDDRPQTTDLVGQAATAGADYAMEKRYVRKDGSILWVAVSAGIIKDEAGRPESIMGVVVDVSDRKRAEDALREAKEVAERASEAKSEFLATLSHELRTPLTPVLLTISLMENSPALPEELREDVATIRRNVELESQLISDLLDLTRISRGKLQLDFQDVDLHLIVRSAIDICQREASAKLRVELAADPHRVHGDSTRLHQIFWNLINNAMKFTGADGLVTIRSTNGSGGQIRVEITDTGIGIDSAVLPRLFTAFEQGEVRAERQQAGLGLGLAISRRLVELHGGTIAVHSEGRGHGATFTVELPLIKSPKPVPAIRPTTPPAAMRPLASGPALALLLIEDHEPTLHVMTKLLRNMGHRVTQANSVASGVSAARREAFDVIISDLGLPDGSGLDVMRDLRDAYAGRAIALTGYGAESDVIASREAGFAEHLIKPVDVAALQAAVTRVADAARRR